MTVTVVTDKHTYVFDNTKEVYVKECDMSIEQSKEHEFGKGWIIKEDGEDDNTQDM